MINEVKAVWPWMGNVVEAVYTVAHGLWVTFRTWITTYRPDRKTFTEHFEYPELPVPVACNATVEPPPVLTLPPCSTIAPDDAA